MANTALKPDDHAARSYADRLLLEKLSQLDAVVKVSELAEQLSEHSLGLGAVRSLLASNPERFAFHERRWIPAQRLNGAGRPMVSAMEEAIDAFNGPTSLAVITHELARTLGQDEDEIAPIVRRLAEEHDSFVLDSSERVALTRWGFLAVDEPKARALDLNGVDAAELDEVAKKVGSINFEADDAVATAVKKAGSARLRVLGALFWSHLNLPGAESPRLYSSRRLLKAVLELPGYVLGPSHEIVPEATTKQWITAAIRLADKLVPAIEVEDAQPIDVKPEDITQITAKVLGAEDTVTGTRLLEEIYEITPGSRTFPDDLASLMAAAMAQDGIVWVGGDRLQKKGLVPEGLDALPEPFLYVDSGAIGEDDEPMDVELTDEGLNTTLRKLITHPLATDVLDEVAIPAPKVMPDSQRLVLKAIHRELGTFPLCQFYNGWLQTEPNLQEFVVIDGNGQELKVWVNHKDRIMYNWIEWWLDQPIENGAVFTLTKTNRPNVFDFAWSDQPDSLVYISKQRMDALRDLANASEGKSGFELLCEIMQHWTKGADFLTLHAELNIVRRVRARLVASLLSSYDCFYQRQNSPVWHFDPKKVALGFNKAKRKFAKK